MVNFDHARTCEQDLYHDRYDTLITVLPEQSMIMQIEAYDRLALVNTQTCNFLSSHFTQP